MRRPPKWKNSAAGGHRLQQATADDLQLKKLRPPKTAVDHRSSAGVWTTAKKVGGPAAGPPRACRGPADDRRRPPNFFVILHIFGGLKEHKCDLRSAGDFNVLKLLAQNRNVWRGMFIVRDFQG